MTKKQKVATLEEAIQVCEKNFLNVQFELDIDKKMSGAEDFKFVTISSNPYVKVKGKTLIEAVNAFLSAVKFQQESLDKKIIQSEEKYNKDLYCTQCGEDDVNKLAYEANYGCWEKWNCKCGHSFQIKALPSE